MQTKRNNSNIILISDQTGKASSIVRFLKPIMKTTLRNLKIKSKELSLSLVSNTKIQTLNKKYRKLNKPTDVLSFEQKNNSRTLGDIIISIPTARKQAAQQKKPVHEECAMLAIHGLLHLLGYDHERSSEARIMFSLQNQLLKQVLSAD